MKVFVLEGLIDYEGSSVLGVYSSAEEAAEAARAYHYMEDTIRRYNGYVASEVELGAPANYDACVYGVRLKLEVEDEYD